VLALLGASLSARAEASVPNSAVGTAAAPILPGWVEGRLLPGFQSPGFHSGGGIPQGLVLGMDLGPEFATPQAQSETVLDLTLGAHAGYAFGNGVSLLGHFDVLGTHLLLVPAPQENLFTFGVRYALPAFVLEPFAEAQLGVAFVNGGAIEPGLLGTGLTVVGGPALGLLIPLGPIFAVSLSARDWLTFFEGYTTQTFAVEIGFEFTLGSAVLPR
jgi:hypothetical protein